MNIIVKGTYTGTVSDVEGKYIISDVPADGILVFSYLGMLTEEITVAGQTVVDLVMVEAIQNNLWVDWNDILLNNGVLQSHQVSITGGSETTAYMLSGGMYKEEGPVKDDYTRYNTRLNLDHTINKWAKSRIRLGRYGCV